MISKISLSNVASYKDETEIKNLDKINLFYGLNGSGKTTLSKYLYEFYLEKNNQSNSILHYNNCKIENYNNEKILVYNQNFIDSNFYQKDKLNGIFTLSGENKEAQENIDKAKSEIEYIEKELVKLGKK